MGDKLPFPSHVLFGKYEHLGSNDAWFPNRIFYFDWAFKVRRPNVSNPSSYIRHWYTEKFCRELKEREPKLYEVVIAVTVAFVAGIDSSATIRELKLKLLKERGYSYEW